jgi:hypothetical protein
MFNPYPCQVRLYQKGFSFGKSFGKTFLIEVLGGFFTGASDFGMEAWFCHDMAPCDSLGCSPFEFGLGVYFW